MNEMRENLKAELETLCQNHNSAYGDFEQNFAKDLEDLILQKMSWAKARGFDEGLNQALASLGS